MKILVAGAGAFGKEHLKTLAAIEGVRLAVADPREAALGAARTAFPLADGDGDAFSLLHRFDPDGVVIATPADVHAGLATAALERGVPTLVEKPVAPDSPAMRRLCAAAEKSRAFLQPGHILRFSAGHRRLREVLEGELGDLVQVSSRRYRDDSHALRYTDTDPVLMTLIHDIDLALWYDGGTALAAEAVRRPPGTARSLTAARLESTSGAVWQLSTAWLHEGAECPPDRVEILGTLGSAEFETGGRIEIFGRNRRRIDIDTADDPLRAELDCFLAGIRVGSSQAPVSPQDALNGLLAAELVLDRLRRP